MLKGQKRFLLDESELPRQWYNIQADMVNKPLPMLDPATKKPVTVDDLSRVPNGEAEVVKVTLKPKNRLKTLQFDVDFAKLSIKGRGAQGNLVTKNEVHRFSLKERGASTLGGRDVWFDHDVMRINYEGRGEYLGEFFGHDQVLVILKNGEFYTSGFEATNHYEDNVLRIEKFRPKTVWTAILND